MNKQQIKKVPFIDKICKIKCPNYDFLLSKVSFEYTSSNLNEIKCMLLGANPGKDEAIVGRPFIGKSGRFLRECLEEVDFPHSVIANAVLCSTNDTSSIPNFNECLKICSIHWFYVLKKIQNIKCLICLGQVAYQSVRYAFKLNKSHKKIKFSQFNYFGKVKRKDVEVDLFVIPHPSYFVRKGYDKETYCSYLLKILNFLNKEENISEKLNNLF